MLRDLEELLLTITDSASREFMREAVRCYNVGAHRAAVVMAVAAGMDDRHYRVRGRPRPAYRSD
jgi:hypothetical protein